MRAGKYSIKELFVNRYLEQIIIPEIQRDYVWDDENVKGFLNSLKRDFDKLKNPKILELNENDHGIKSTIQEFYNKLNYSSNIGFIYAYNDEQYSGKYFLIDGQQRITTIYLLLLTLANRNEQLRDQFKRTYLIDGLPKIDYRVRESSHEFLRKFTTFVLENNDQVEKQNWFYQEYTNDKTINTLITNYKCIHEYLDKESLDDLKFFNYLQDYVEFWYFDTNVSEQGEELYIYMNARGEQMQSNENIKADLLSRLENTQQKNEYGHKWEEWQDFFWLHKGKSENADKGFNEFLACISGLENYLKNERGFFYQPQFFEKNNGIKVNQILKTIDLNTIEKYFNGLEFLEKNKEAFKSDYNYADWVDLSLNEIWSILTDKTNWYADYTDKNRSGERNRMVYLWSILYFLSKVDLATIEITEVFRFLRIFHLRYNNFNRSVNNIMRTADLILNKGVLDSYDHTTSDPDEQGRQIIDDSNEETDIKARTKEELLKINILNKYFNDLDQQKTIEEAIWKIEDIPLNKDGRDVKGLNITHLIDLENADINTLNRVLNRFSQLLDNNNKNLKQTVQNILLYYGEYWYQVSPYYYYNYEFDNWKRIIRDIGVNQEDNRTNFRRFFNDFLNFEGSLDKFLSVKRNEIIGFEDATDLRKKLIWYNQNIDNNMWSEGNHIAIAHGSVCSLPDWQNKDKVFDKDFIFYNTKGNLKGGSPRELFHLLPEEIKSQFNLTEPIVA